MILISKLFIYLIIFAVGGALGYVKGKINGRSELEALDSDYQKRLNDAYKHVGSLQSEVMKKQNRS